MMDNQTICNTALFLMTQKGFFVLERLCGQGFAPLISKVVIGRDKNVDNDYSQEIQNLCIKYGITYFDYKSEYHIHEEYTVAISWRRLIINLDQTKPIIFHDSLLPKYRGFAPLVNMIINRENKIGVTAIFASEAYDTGGVITHSYSEISYPITIAEAIDIVCENYAEPAIKIFNSFSNKIPLAAHQQDEYEATYSLWRDEDDYQINWNKSAEEILTFVNAVSSPYKGASTFINGKQKIRILKCEEVADLKIENRDTGKVIFSVDHHPVIVCGKELLKLSSVKNDNGENALPFENFRVRLGAEKTQ